MKIITTLLILSTLMGCSSREPIGTVQLTVDLDKEKYEKLLKQDYSPSTELGLKYTIYGTPTSTSPDGISLSIPITTNITLIGYNKFNLNEIAFRQKLEWGKNTYETDLYNHEVIIAIKGRGPGGVINQFIDELQFLESQNKYEVIITEKNKDNQKVE